ncbi:MAG: FAD-binding protein [Chloroflexi bacterium]|nr:FAD-binding protein [Chloroflexota bacterium]
MQRLFDNSIEVDVLVVGGALTGLYAGIRAKEAGARTLVVDKATSGKSGCVAFAGGDVTLVLPEDEFDAYVRQYESLGQGLVDRGWIKFTLAETLDRVMELDAWGVPFEKDSAGRFARKGGRGGAAPSAVVTGPALLDAAKRAAKQRGLEFLNKVMVTHLLVGDGRVAGAAGFNVETGETYLLKAGAVVCVAGPCAFKSTYIGHRMCTGDGTAAAYRCGAELESMEFAVGHNSGPREYDIAGLARFVAMGARFVNREGYAFMGDYSPELKDKAPFGALARAMAMEVKAGRGPIYFDMTAINAADYELSRKIVTHTFKTLDRAGVDLRRDRVEWIPTFQGNMGCRGGLRIGKDFSTTIPGLFTGGDTGAIPWYGAEAGYHGINLAWCCISGHHAGINAARWARGADRPRVDDEQAADVHRAILAPLRRGTGKSPDDVILAVQQTLIPYDVVILKHEDRLKRALAAMVQERRECEETVRAEDSHDLVKAHEAANMCLVGEMILRASLLRTESRGTHYREDYPQPDDEWLKIVCFKDDGGEMRFWTEPLVHTQF